MPPIVRINRADAKPIHRQIYEEFRALILGRSLQPGQQVPSTRALATDLGVSRIPAVNAYAQLIAEGYFETRSGAGTFISVALPGQVLSHTVSGRDKRVVPSTPPWTRGTGAFSVGQLAYDHFPFRVWSEMVTRHARKVQPRSMNYGDPMGSRHFREVIAAYLRTSRAVQCDAAQIMVVNGSQHALDLSARVLLDRGNPVWVEEPGYEFLWNALRLGGCKMIPVPVDGEGLDASAAGVSVCAAVLARRVCHAVASISSWGATMSASRRLQLLDWAHRSNAWVVEDDYDSEYRYESQPIASLQGLDRGSRVIYIGTFSKTLFPSLRLGYIVIPHALVDRFAEVRRASDLCAPHLYQAAAAEFLEQGHFARHVRKNRLLYAERRSALVQSIRAEFRSTVEILGAEAGMHLVMTLPPGLSDQKISARAAQQDLWLWPLSSAYQGSSVRQGLILGFGCVKASDMPALVQRLRRE